MIAKNIFILAATISCSSYAGGDHDKGAVSKKIGVGITGAAFCSYMAKGCLDQKWRSSGYGYAGLSLTALTLVALTYTANKTYSYYLLTNKSHSRSE